MTDANGALKASRPGVNGAVKGPLNGRAVAHPARPATRPRSRPSGPGLLARAFSIAARLLTWYSIFSILFRCPASLDACDDSSPRICKPYFQLKRAVAPHAEPYYHDYVAPYVDLAWPYYNAVDQRVIAPTWALAQHYGAPHAERLRVLGEAQWEKTVQPQVEKYQELAKAQYDEKLAPHIDRASAALGPYLDIARTNSLQTYHGLIVPAFEYVQPHLLEGYRAASVFTSNTVVPAFVWTWNKTYAFLDGTVGPQIRAVYTETVEPQLVKIGKRLGRYSTTKKTVPKTLTDSSTSASTGTSSSFTKPAASVPVTSSAPAPSASVHHEEDKSTDPARSRASIEPIPPPEIDEKLEQEDPNRRSAREIVAADLQDWQERYTRAADEGAAEIDERVQEIAKKMIRRNARITGKALLDELRTAAVSELVMLRRAILSVVGLANKDRLTHEDATEEVIKAVRQAGMAVKEKAQAVRTWRESYENEMKVLVTKAAETHFTILENIRDLALQRIGMKWAWMDGVTYKDWAKYHLLKSRFDEWKGDLENHIVSHPSLEAAQLEAANIEDEAMKVASATAKELARLKQVANWKLIAADDTPEFDTALMQQAAEAAKAAKVAAAGAAEAVDEAVERAAKDAGEDAVEASDAASEESERPIESEPLSETSPSSEDSQTSSTEEEPESAPEDESIPSASEATPEAENGSETAASSLMFETPVIVANATELTEEKEVVTVEVPVQETPAEEDSPFEPVEEPVEEDESDAQPAVESAASDASSQPVDALKPVVHEEEEEDAPAL
ncbi:hypothetical protein C8A05DRAFT_14837 [Staphylotrichum tortipilum]|uniref:Transcription factor hoxa13 n=1 Tax=Staphylotrichum tortipilum TaxID=2831512 RepID=A0AAN6MMX6_9PEZI|nr:hypothetical protein C8A05DRAFT_14837 [Staphylotrichum longicolle]